MGIPPALLVALEVTAAPGPALVQDGGRPGYMHHGVPPGGALVPELLAAANRAVRNAPGAAALEAFGELVLHVRGGPLWVAMDGHAWRAAPDERIVVPRPAHACVSYVAVRGGLAVPRVLGGQGTLLGAGFGGMEGRLLRRGDWLVPAHAPEVRWPTPPGAGLASAAPGPAGQDAAGRQGDAPIRVVPGPDQARFPAAAYATLLEQTFTVTAASNRVGMRLAGPRLERHDDDTAASTPMTRGAIQVPAAGELIVLGPDHPTTGGYPVIATVIRADLGRLAGKRAGSVVRFVKAHAAENAYP